MTDVEPLHPWDVSADEAKELQLELRERLVLEPPADFRPRRVAGADLSIVRGRDTGHAALVVVDLESLETVEEATAAVEVDFPYVPGLLSFRELPPLAAAWRRLARPPDAVVFDAHGLAHPRRFGLACHGGLLFDAPSIGVAKSVLVGEHEEPGREKGATTPLAHGEEVVGTVLRSRTDVRPVYVSVGHRMNLETAVEVVLAVTPRYRLAAPIRRAHELANRSRRRDE